MSLSARQREILHQIGIPVWVPRHAPVAASADSGTLPEVAVGFRHAPPAAGNAPVGPVAQLGWEGLQARVAACTACTALAGRRTQTVFGVGDPKADWLFIGEAPGAEEDRRGEPFVGRAGQLLDNMLAALGLRRGDNVYIANILKCRPPGNRDPLPEEASACRPFLDRQIALIQPRVIVALGRVAAQSLLESDAPLGTLRGREHDFRGTPLVITYHPAYLLRSPADKARAWSDLLLARARALRA
jgi:uracil-DNA glycosylase